MSAFLWNRFVNHLGPKPRQRGFLADHLKKKRRNGR